VDASQARLDKIPNILKRFRQSVLAAATSGELTQEWREKNQAKYSFKEYIFNDLLVELRNGLSPKPNQEGKGSAILRISSVRSGVVEQLDIRHLECDEKTVDKYKLKIGDLLFTRYNGSIEFVGVCGLLRELKHNELLYPDKLIRARLNNLATPEYIEIYFSSDQARKNMTDCIKSTSGQKGISGKDIKAQKVMLPSTEEQNEIVRRVESLFTMANTAEKQYNNAKARTNRLTQSILAKAFRGELVPQDANDEPAELLLKKIQITKQMTPKLNKRKKPIPPNKVVPTILNIENVKKWIDKTERETFTSEDIIKSFSSSYEELKQVIFLLLNEKKPSVEQVFDSKAKDFVFRKVK